MTATTPVRRTAAYRPFAVRLTARQQLSPNVVRLTFTGDELDQCGTTRLDQRIKLVLADTDQIATAIAQGDDWYAWWLGEPDEKRPVMRTYTVRAVRTERSEVDIDFVCHGTEGPASAFAVQAPLGSETLLVLPDAGVPGSESAGVAWRPGSASDLVLVGDETAAPAIGNIVETLPEDATGRVLIEVPHIADALELSAPSGVSVTWLARGGRPHGEALEQAVAEWADGALSTAVGTGASASPEAVELSAEEILWDEADAPGRRYVWVAAEAGVVARLRRYLIKERGLDRHSASFMGYWKVGRAI